MARVVFITPRLSKVPCVFPLPEIFAVCIVGHADLLSNSSNPAGLRMHEQRSGITATDNWVGIGDWIFMHFRPLNLPFIDEKNNLISLSYFFKRRGKLQYIVVPLTSVSEVWPSDPVWAYEIFLNVGIGVPLKVIQKNDQSGLVVINSVTYRLVQAYSFTATVLLLCLHS